MCAWGLGRSWWCWCCRCCVGVAVVVIVVVVSAVVVVIVVAVVAFAVVSVSVGAVSIALVLSCSSCCCYCVLSWFFCWCCCSFRCWITSSAPQVNWLCSTKTRAAHRSQISTKDTRISRSFGGGTPSGWKASTSSPTFCEQPCFFARIARAGSSKMHIISPCDPLKMNTLDCSKLNISTWRHQQGERIGEECFSGQGCTSWDMGNRLNVQTTWAGGETKDEYLSGYLTSTWKYFAFLVSMHASLNSVCYSISTACNGPG